MHTFAGSVHNSGGARRAACCPCPALALLGVGRRDRGPCIVYRQYYTHCILYVVYYTDCIIRPVYTSRPTIRRAYRIYPCRVYPGSHVCDAGPVPRLRAFPAWLPAPALHVARPVAAPIHARARACVGVCMCGALMFPRAYYSAGTGPLLGIFIHQGTSHYTTYLCSFLALVPCLCLPFLQFYAVFHCTRAAGSLVCYPSFLPCIVHLHAAGRRLSFLFVLA